MTKASPIIEWTLSAIAALTVCATAASVAPCLAHETDQSAPAPSLTEISDGLIFGGRAGPRVHFSGSRQQGYDVSFECPAADGWQRTAAFPSGQVWSVYSEWRDSWYGAPTHVKAQKVEPLSGGRVRAWAEAEVADQRWWFSDVYSFEHGMVRIDRSFAHPGTGTQSNITLESRIRLPLGKDQRMLVPGSLYNNNPSSTRSGPRISTEPGGLGLYEEHRLPVPMVNMESDINGRRTYGSLVSMPSKILQGHKGNDHWWSLGLEYGKDSADLLSVSGPVATNGKKSQLYGHRDGFDPYDEAYLDVNGPVVFEKTLYVDVGAGIRTGYAFRETLWKAFEVFRPTEVPHVPFAEAMKLVAGFGKTLFYSSADGKDDAAGYRVFPKSNVMKFGWVGGNLGIACGMLAYSEHTGDEEARRQAIATVQFFVKNSRAGTEGLHYGDYSIRGRWSSRTIFGAAALGISSRQFGENLEHLASLVELGRRLKLPETNEWLATLKRAGDFLLRSPRYKELFPMAWTADGKALGWPPKGEPKPASVSAAGAQCVVVLARLATLTGEAKYGDAAAKAMDAYWREFGETLAIPPWGATLDGGCEDKEAGWGLMRAATAVHEVTRDPRFIAMARDAADWTLTWMYFHNIGLKPESGLLHEYLHTVGWTFISKKNQEIDTWGYYMAPDYYRLGQLANDARYCQIGRVLFEASTQTISRPGAMFGPVPGIQGEHYNHSNCTYLPGQPWRGSQHSLGISWMIAGVLYGGMHLSELDPEHFWFGPPATVESATLPNTKSSAR